MASANINVNKQTVLQLLTSGQEIPFVIPEYQRPYSWSVDEICTLFDDLWNFSFEREQSNGAKSYFLGCVVSYKENEERQIIDGQQRITSLFLLLRAVFSMLENGETKTDIVSNFIREIEPAIWKKDEMTGIVDRTQMLLKSEVVSDSGNELLRNILETGVAKSDATDNYSKNYNKFIELYTEKAKSEPLQMFQFILSLLKYTILLPIDADDQETALTIFNTLNNRGLLLSDADIFKSYIYKTLNDVEKKAFIEKWKKLETDSAKVSESIQSLFYYHMFYIRAKDNDVKTTTPGVRKYYLEKGKNRLSADVIDSLVESLHLWEVVNGRDSIETESWSQNIDIRKILDCLSSYSNEFWKYPVSIFYMQHKQREDFEDLFLKFLRKFYVMLLVRFLEAPTISAVKGDILKLNAEIIRTNQPVFAAGFEEKKTDNQYELQAEKVRTDNLLIKPNSKVERMILKLLAYQEEGQTTMLPNYWEIEHIFPQKWDSKYFTLTEEEANDKLEHIGNKLPLEKKLNISASNNYFNKKKEKYKSSAIAMSKKLGESSLDEWTLTNIEQNDEEICKQLKKLFKQWIEEYEFKETPSSQAPELTEEELAVIKSIQEKGYKISLE
jgi:uncharacterized protein with ParB-like and HNH nuclease domain